MKKGERVLDQPKDAPVTVGQQSGQSCPMTREATSPHWKNCTAVSKQCCPLSGVTAPLVFQDHWTGQFLECAKARCGSRSHMTLITPRGGKLLSLQCQQLRWHADFRLMTFSLHCCWEWVSFEPKRLLRQPLCQGCPRLCWLPGEEEGGRRLRGGRGPRGAEETREQEGEGE